MKVLPLIEIVSRPEIRTPAEAYLFLQRLRSVLRYTSVCNGNLEQGSFRCDANVSIRPCGQTALGTRTELKNLNSFRNVQRALEYEIRRQADLVESGGEVEQQTVMWDAAAGVTRPMRSKEEAHDYRYFPEPDLQPLVLDPSWIERERAALPELPHIRKQRLVDEHGLRESDAHMLTLEAGLADYFEEVARLSGNPRVAANYVLNDLLREQNAAKRDESEIPLPARRLAELIGLVDQGTISATVARQELFPEIYRSGRSAAELVRERGLEQVDDDAALREMVRSVMESNPEKLERYRAGKTALFGYFVGQAMKASGGKANPNKLNELLRELL